MRLIFLAVLLMLVAGCERPRNDNNLQRFSDTTGQPDTESKEVLKGEQEAAGVQCTSAEEKTDGLNKVEVDGEFERVEYHSKLQHRRGLYYVVNEQEPYSGIAKRMYLNGQLAWKACIKSGKRDGLSRDWDENGKLASEANYKDDKLLGLSKAWYRNGTLKRERNYKNNKLDGLSRLWSREGLLKDEFCYSNGGEVSIEHCQGSSSG